ncbi:zinc finger protein 112-like isoform X4 [Ostrea edulis]|nr:zinc finger protein 112-like isoform X4 [Ostrea edulis]XP_055996576.1 zinc finger protein 112-like isoform X4 [Ostrea edulis]
MLNDSDTKRLEIRKGKFLFKLTVRGNTETLSKFLKHADQEPGSVGGYTRAHQDQEDSNFKESDRDYNNTCVFPPIQMCKTHPGTWNSSSNLYLNTIENDKVENSEVKLDEGFTDKDGEATENDDGKKQNDRNSSHVTSVVNYEFFKKAEYKETKTETNYSSANICRMEYLNSDFVTLNDSNTSEEATVVTETKPSDLVYNYVISEDEDHDETHYEYDYILDSDNSRCQTPVDISERTESVSKQYNPEYKNVNEENNNRNTRIESHNHVSMCGVHESVKQTEIHDYVSDNVGPKQEEIVMHSTGMNEDDGEATETEFDPLEGDEWEQMETLNHSIDTSDSVGKEEAEGGVTDEDSSSTDFEDLISQYVTYMPREISRSVNSKRRAARMSPTSATYRRCSTELKRLKKFSNVKVSPNDQKTEERMTHREKKNQACKVPENKKETGLKECHVCNKEFEPRILERHVRSHTGERPYACDQCPFRCSQFGNLNKHKSFVHKKKDNGDGRIFKFKCDTCNKRFYDKAHLRRHTVTHFEKSVKHYSCLVCKKRFRFNSGLHRHMQLHKDGLKICCGICNKRFYDSSGLNKHLEQHTNQLPYRCEPCRCSFRSPHALRRHKASHMESRKSTTKRRK